MCAVSDREAVFGAVSRLRAACEELAGLSFDALTTVELLGVLDELERARRRQPTVEHEVLNALRQRMTPVEIGAKNWSEMLQQRLRISAADARRRLAEAAELGPRRTITGEVLEPLMPNVAKRQAGGEIGAEHVRLIRTFFRQLPAVIDYQTRQGCEETLAQLAAEHTPDVLRKAADRLAALVNPDGVFSDIDRARKRGLTLHQQNIEGLSRLSGWLDPEARAVWEAICAKWAAPGMGNPDDEAPCVDGAPTEQSQHRDMRSQAQRNHDAFKAVGRAMLASGQLGQHNGLPVTIIVSTTLQELQSAAGHAVTGGGSLLPMAEVIRMAAHAYHYLAVFDKCTEVPLFLGRTKRLASAGQRIVLHAKDRGCSYPGCTVPGYGCQVHHAELDWAHGGLTDITDETLACGPHNRLVTQGGWTTRKRKDGRTQWIPPPHLDTGQTRINRYHHPQELLAPQDDDEDDP